MLNSLQLVSALEDTRVKVVVQFDCTTTRVNHTSTELLTECYNCEPEVKAAFSQLSSVSSLLMYATERIEQRHAIEL
jgi:hypothetical protein